MAQSSGRGMLWVAREVRAREAVGDSQRIGGRRARRREGGEGEAKAVVGTGAIADVAVAVVVEGGEKTDWYRRGRVRVDESGRR